MNFKRIVLQIRDLPWQTLDGKELQRLMFISHVYAVEFAEALRIALREYPDNADLLQMARGELDTTNLRFGDYHQAGDHAHFLEHFLARHGIGGDDLLHRHAREYLLACRGLSAPVRAMSVFSREEELSGIFREILLAPDWTAAGLDAFRFYLSQHILFDATDGGHHDLTKAFGVDDRLVPFYTARLNTYRSIPKLFSLEDEDEARSVA